MSNQIAVIQDPVLASRDVLPSNLDAGARDVVLVLAASIRNNHHQAARRSWRDPCSISVVPIPRGYTTERIDQEIDHYADLGTEVPTTGVQRE
jgi:hypothetical protein